LFGWLVCLLFCLLFPVFIVLRVSGCGFLWLVVYCLCGFGLFVSGVVGILIAICLRALF